VTSHSVGQWFDFLPAEQPGPVLVTVPPDCGLAVVDLPGHGRRLLEPCLRDVESVVDGLAAALEGLPATGLVLLGYSLGGWIAYDLAVRLTEAGAPPAGLVLCGTRAPQTGLGHKPIAHLPAGEPFLRAAVELGLAAPEMLEVPSLAEVFGTALHADLTITATYRYRLRAPLPVRACVVGFSADWVVPEPSLRAWDALCTRPPLHRRMEGGHLAMHEREQAFGEVVRDALDHVLGVGETP
jgi:surfactin synthase thioesterase subunit